MLANPVFFPTVILHEKDNTKAFFKLQVVLTLYTYAYVTLSL